MTQQAESVVTPERFEQGLRYHDYVASVDRNRARFEENYAGTQVSGDMAAKLRELAARPNGPAKMAVIGEDWCPDVFRGAPVLAKIAETAGFDLRYFKRDENKDMIAEFLNGGEFESIPVAVFYTKDHRYIGHWVERPAKANEQMRELAPMYARMRKPDKTPAEAEEAKREYIAFQNGPIWGGWRDETVREIVEMLDEQTR